MMTAEQLVANIQDMYALVGTYRDAGVVEETVAFTQFGTRGLSTVQFTTAFARPGQLRFESRHLHASGKCYAHRLAWADGDDFRVWSHRGPQLLRPSSLSGTFAVPTATVQPVLGLLTAGQVDWWLTNLVDPSRLADGDIDGVACHRVRCWCSFWSRALTPEEQAAVDAVVGELERLAGLRVPPGRTVYLPLTVWADRRTLLIRRVESGTITDRAVREHVVTCRPEADIPLDPAELAFDPPEPEGME
jgi:hypothetical protein